MLPLVAELPRLILAAQPAALSKQPPIAGAVEEADVAWRPDHYSQKSSADALAAGVLVVLASASLSVAAADLVFLLLVLAHVAAAAVAADAVWAQARYFHGSWELVDVAPARAERLLPLQNLVDAQLRLLLL